MSASKHYSKNLTKLISFRLSDELQSKASVQACNQGISFSDFMRQSIMRNLKEKSDHNVQTTLKQ